MTHETHVIPSHLRCISKTKTYDDSFCPPPSLPGVHSLEVHTIPNIYHWYCPSSFITSRFWERHLFNTIYDGDDVSCATPTIPTCITVLLRSVGARFAF